MAELNLLHVGTTFFPVVLFHLPPRPNGFYNDVAVFTLKAPVQFSQYIQPICLPTGRYSEEEFTHTLPLALGWGTTYYDGEEVPR